MATSRLEIDLSAVERNLGHIRGVVGSDTSKAGAPVAVCAVLKQDGYGLGAARLAKRLAGSGVEMFAVYTMDEARTIADAVANVPILVLMPVTAIERMDPIYRHVTAGRVHITVHSEDQVRQLSESCTRIGAMLPVHVQVDTGLSRGGVPPEKAQALVQQVVGGGGSGGTAGAGGSGGGSGRMKLAGLMTHFASPCCDADFTREQARLFRDFVEEIKPLLKAAVAASGGARTGAPVVAPNQLMLHAANSCALFRARSYHGTMVRPGQALLGYALDDVPADGAFEFRQAAAKLEPAVRWTSTVVHISEIPAGWPVGYGSTWRAPWRADGKKTRIALIPVGYADGYPRSLGGRATGGPGWVRFTGRRWERPGGGEGEAAEGLAHGHAGDWVAASVVGRVSMDQITVDVTDVPEAMLAGTPEVELIGRERSAPNFISTLASGASSITHELLCRIGPRVERVYRYPAGAVAGPPASSASAGSSAGGGPSLAMAAYSTATRLG